MQQETFLEIVNKIMRNLRSRIHNAKETDPLLSVMIMCKESLRKQSDPFVRLVTSAPEPMSILCTNGLLQRMI